METKPSYISYQKKIISEALTQVTNMIKVTFQILMHIEQFIFRNIDACCFPERPSLKSFSKASTQSSAVGTHHNTKDCSSYVRVHSLSCCKLKKLLRLCNVLAYNSINILDITCCVWKEHPQPTTIALSYRVQKPTQGQDIFCLKLSVCRKGIKQSVNCTLKSQFITVDNGQVVLLQTF